jgi:S-(hydroxymethyl)glutathione dehydrogenase/alcohol dehydrogenase
MKLAVWYEFGKPAVIEDVNIDPTGPGKVKLKIMATAICGSDIHSVKGEHGECKMPILAGHEIAAIVDEVGEGVSYVKPGDHVVASLVKAGCGQCRHCITGHPHLCPKGRQEFKLPGCYTLKDGTRPTATGGPLVGFAEYTLAPEECLIKIPEDMPFDVASLLGCGVISGFGAVTNAAQVKPFESVLVMGTGGVGLNAIQAARFVGANPIIAVDTFDNKLKAAYDFGATHTINVKTEADLIAKVMEITEGEGVDYTFVTVAGIEAKRQAFSMLAMNGKQVIIGHGVGEMLSDFDAVEFVGGKTMTGSAMGRARTRVDIPNIIKLYKAGRYKLDELISNRYPLEKINEAMEETEKGGALRNVIMF